MKRTNRILFTVLIFALTLMLAFSVFASAQGVETENDGEATEGNGVVGSEYSVQHAEEEENATFLGRIWEAVTSEKNGILDRALDIVILVGFAILGKVISKLKGKITKDITTLGSSNAENAKTQSDFNKGLLNGFNELVEEVSGLEKRLEDVLKDETAVASLLTVDMTLLEILTTIYPNSKNLPQGVKDIVELKYANCLKVLNSEEKLSAIISVIHGNSEVCSNDETNEVQTA